MVARESDRVPTSYWYADRDGAAEPAVLVLRALRRFHAADSAMRERLRVEMDMNESDLRALRHLISAEPSGRAIAPKDLARLLGISSAATAKLLARLVGSGHLRREVNPNDHRAQLLHVTPAAHLEVRKTLSSMHERMLAVAENLTRDQQETVINFLNLLSAAVDAPKEVAAPGTLPPTVPLGTESPGSKGTRNDTSHRNNRR
ncbi:MarR family transcriptional regulator [Saxibacter everestensis]|uniref:MarR family transcriptional regulator n=1 Tax=Saxibacter everestensis TaxID=2909229 RepID=A0ABY8QRM1_9MICO|nr:MarR family transcriptional regulator [Brevibacteriaceae bacterium ZFBP1038]